MTIPMPPVRRYRLRYDDGLEDTAFRIDVWAHGAEDAIIIAALRVPYVRGRKPPLVAIRPWVRLRELR
jgi:hypothetical protein